MRWHELWIAAVVVCSVTSGVVSLRGSELVLAAKAKAAEEKLNPTTEEVTVVVGDDGNKTTVVKTKPKLTGIPQIDYIHDPNLPRELNGHNLSSYPFYNSVPKDIEFECDGLHDGFYASVLHHCQVYHHCLFGTRYDFLCANYTAFDQKTFICHFVSEVDCDNSPKYYIRNEALYKQSETTTAPTTKAPTTTTTTTTTEAPRKSAGGRRRRPYRRRRPIYEYYYDDEAYDDEYYDEEDDPPPRKSNRRQQKPSGSRREEQTSTTTTSTTTTPSPPSGDAPLTRAPLSVYKPKVLPKIKRPVPLNEKSKYDYTTRPGTIVPSTTSDPKYDDEEYYDDEYDDPTPPPPPKKKESGKNGRRRMQQERKRPSRYEDEYEDEEEEERPRMRKGNRKEDDYRPRSRGSMGKGKKGHRESEEEAIPSERPGFISGRGGSRKRHQEERGRPDRDRRPQKEYEYYDEEEEEVAKYDDEEDDRRRPSRVKSDKPRSRPKKPTTTTTTTSTTTTTTTTTTTPKPTTSTTTTVAPIDEAVDEEEYEEYDYVEPPPKFKPRSREDKSTTSAPHRFSTASYRTSKITIPTTTTTTTEAPKQKAPITFRPRVKPDFKRGTTSKPEPFNSEVASPAGFKKQDEEPKYRRQSTEATPRRPAPTQGSPVEETPLYRRPPKVDASVQDGRRTNQGTNSEEIKPQIETSHRKNFRPESTPTPSITQPSRNSADINQRRPIKYEYIEPTGEEKEEIQQFRRPYKPDTQDYDKKPDIRNPPKQEPNVPPTAPGFIQRPDENFRRPYKPESYPASGPESQTHLFRRPYQPTAPEGNRRPVEDPQKRPLKQESETSGSEVSHKNVNFHSRNPEQSRYRQQESVPSGPTGSEQYRHQTHEGMPITAAGYRQRTRPGNKDIQKPLDEQIFQSRKPNPSQEPILDQGPNYRNPFINTRPVKEEPDYFKPPKTLQFTAPGPSGEGSTQRPLATYDIDEEYDVTLNDALQPSTLNPTLQYTRVKSRGYQSAVTHPSYRSLLLPSASQNYYSKTPLQTDEYEAVVMPAARFAQARFKQRRPSEWYW